jgi:tetratricopeptide (TPR) repeat protein
VTRVAPALILSLALLTACPKPADPEPIAVPETTVEAVPTTEAGEVTATDLGPEGAEPWGGAATVAKKSPEEMRREQIATAVSYLSVDVPETNQKAIPVLKGVVQADPNNAYAHYNLGLAYEKTGITMQARQSYLAAITANKDFSPPYVNLAGMDMRDGKFKAAEAHYRNGIRHDNDNMDLWTGLVSALRSQGRLVDAEAEAKNALEVNTNALAVYNSLGLVYIDMNKLDRAYFIVEKGLLVPGGDADAGLHCTRGRIHQLNERTGDAKAEFDKALERDPNYVPAMVYLSYYYLDNRNFEDTVSVLEKADKLNPDDIGIMLNLAIGYRGVERYDDAAGLYDRVKLLDPGNPTPYLNLGILFGDYTKEYDKAIAEYELYKSNGGPNVELVDSYIAATLKEQEKVRKLEERKKKMEARQKEKEERERVLEEEAAKPPPAPEPEPPAEEAPAEEVPAEPAPAEPAPAEPEPAPAEPAPAEPAPAEPAPAEPAPEEPAEAPADDNPWGG